MTTGTNDMRIERATAGKSPVITPMMTLGILLSQVNQEIVLRLSILLMAPTTATGMAQKIIMAVIKA